MNNYPNYSTTPTTPQTITPQQNYVQNITNSIALAIARRNQQEAQAAAAAADQPATEPDEAATTSQQQPDPDFANIDADEIYPSVDRFLRDTFTELHHGLRDKKGTWKAWHSVPNGVRSNTGQRLIRELASGQTTPVGAPRPAGVGVQSAESVQGAATRIQRER